MLPAYDGMPMIYWALSSLRYKKEDLILTVLSEHNEKFGVVNGLKEIFGNDICIVTLDQSTRSQAETVAKTLEIAGVNESFFVKDSDNGFELADLEQGDNYICVASLNDFDMINPRNKSYVQVDRRAQIINIREKVVISDLFSVGGYYFSSSDDFQRYYNKLLSDKTDWQTEIYISDVIGAMLLDGIPFRTQHISKYQDWGTITEWEKALLSRKTYFILLDGFLFERGSSLFSPRFQDVKANQNVVDAVRRLVLKGNKIIFISIRDKSYKELTEMQLSKLGLPFADIVFECPVSQYVMITSGHSTLPFQTSLAMEVSPDDTFSLEKII